MLTLFKFTVPLRFCITPPKLFNALVNATLVKLTIVFSFIVIILEALPSMITFPEPIIANDLAIVKELAI